MEVGNAPRAREYICSTHKCSLRRGGVPVAHGAGRQREAARRSAAPRRPPRLAQMAGPTVDPGQLGVHVGESEEALRRLESPNARYGDRALKRGEQQLTMSSKAMAHHHQQVLAHAQSARL